MIFTRYAWLVFSFCFVLFQACGQRIQDADVSPTTDRPKATLFHAPTPTSDDAVKSAYVLVADRFLIKCYLYLPDGMAENSAILPSIEPEVTLDFGPYSLKVGVEYASADAALDQAYPVPFLYYSYRLKHGADLLIQAEQQRSQAHTLPIDLPGVAGEHKCLIHPVPSDPISLPSERDTLVHINVHPHQTFDPTNLLAGQIENLLNDHDLKSFILLEAQKLPFNLSSQLPPVPEATYPFWDPMKGVSLRELKSAEVVVAPQGEFQWEQEGGESFPSKIIMTGGFFKACMTRQLAFLHAAFSESKESLLNLIFVDRWILRQPAMELGQPSELGAIPAYPIETREAGEASFLRLLKAFNEIYSFDDSNLEYRFVYSITRRNKDGNCDPHAVATVSRPIQNAESKKKVIFLNMVECR